LIQSAAPKIAPLPLTMSRSSPLSPPFFAWWMRTTAQRVASMKRAA
jgi:hypothetical protein